MREDIARVRQYELMAIFSPEAPEEQLQSDIDRVSELITQTGGTVTLINRESPWGRRRLAYPIRHNGHDVRDGIYVLYYADMNASSVAEVERDIKLMDNLMRYLVTLQVAEPMIPESQKPAEEQGETPPEGEGGESEGAATAETATAATATVVNEETVTASRTEEPQVEEAEVSETPAPEAAVPEAPAAEADATTPAEETAAEAGEDTGNQG